MGKKFKPTLNWRSFCRWYKVLDCFSFFNIFVLVRVDPSFQSVLRQVGADVLGHPEAAHLVGAEDLGHLLVGNEVLLVVGVLEMEGRKQLRSCTLKGYSVTLSFSISPEGCSS